MKMHPQTTDPRSAGRVTRYHTWERVKEQDVASHTWQLLRILLAIWPDAPRDLLVAVMFHDCGERVTGDLPYPVKSEDPDLKAIMDRKEVAALGAMLPWGVPPLTLRTSHEADVVKLAEFLEMWEWALDEVALGNRCAVLIRDRCRTAASERMLALPPSSEIRKRAVEYINRRAKHVEQYL